MEAIIENFQRCEKAHIKFQSPVGIFGRNEQGKSSVCRGIAEALTDFKLSPEGRNSRPRSGGGASFVKVSEGDSSIELTYPSGKKVIEDWQFKATPESAGLVNIPELPAKEFTKLIQTILKTTPTKAEFAKIVKGYDYTEKEINTVWEFIESRGDQGWDKAHASYKDEGVKYKGKWEQVTGASFQPKSGETWQPDGWEKDLESESEESLGKVIADEQYALEALIKDQGISEEEINKLQECFLGLDLLQVEHSQAQEELKAAEAALEASREEYAKLERPVTAKEYAKATCAYCGEENIQIPGKGLCKRDAIPPVDTTRNASLQAALDEAAAAGKRLKDNLEVAKSKVFRLNLEIGNANQAGKRIRESKVGSTDQKAIEAQRVRIEHATRRLTAYRKRRDASQIFASFKKNQHLIDVLDVSGLRQKKLSAALGEFNNGPLKSICEVANWPEVKINTDLSVTYKGFNYTNLSPSAKYRTQVALQFAVAHVQGAQIVICDGADILDKEGRGGFLDLMVAFNWIVIFNCVKDSIEECPDLSTDGGISYYLENGHAIEIKGAELEEVGEGNSAAIAAG